MPGKLTLYDGSLEVLQKHADELRAIFADAKAAGAFSEAEFLIRSSVLEVAVAQNTTVSERLRAYEQLAKYDGMVAARNRQAIEKVTDMSAKELLWKACNRLGMDGFQQKNFGDYCDEELAEAKEKMKIDHEFKGIPEAADLDI